MDGGQGECRHLLYFELSSSVWLSDFTSHTRRCITSKSNHFSMPFTLPQARPCLRPSGARVSKRIGLHLLSHGCPASEWLDGGCMQCRLQGLWACRAVSYMFACPPQYHGLCALCHLLKQKQEVKARGRRGSP